MKSIALLFASLLCVFSSLLAQREIQNRNVVNVSNQGVSRNSSYAVAGRDSTLLELINYRVEGLEIISCTNCYVQKNEELAVEIKNKGQQTSHPATVTVDYYTKGLTSIQIGGGEVTQRKMISPLAPGESTKLRFEIGFALLSGENKKTVSVSLMEHKTYSIKDPINATIGLKSGDGNIGFINFDVDGLIITSCHKCLVTSSVLEPGSRQVEVEIKNISNKASDPATVWIDYYLSKTYGWGAGGGGQKTARKTIHSLNPGQTTTVIFDISFSPGDFNFKYVSVSLTANRVRTQ